MKKRCKYLFILTFIIASLFYRVGSMVTMAAEEIVVPATGTETEPEIKSEPNTGSIAGSEAGQEPNTGSVVGSEGGQEPVIGPKADSEPNTGPIVGSEGGQEPVIGPEADSEPDTEPIVGSEGDWEPVVGPEAEPAFVVGPEMEPEAKAELIMERIAKPTPTESVSTGQALLEWLESHKNSGGTVRLLDNVVLDGYYSFCPNGRDMPSVFVDTDKYTITVKGEIELLSDNHLIFSGKPDGKGIFYVAPKGMLSMEGITVEGGRCALWQEEGAGLVAANCSISGSIHYAEMPYVLYYNNVICAVVEKGQTPNDVLPAQIRCTVNRQGRLSSNEWVPVLWNMEGTERQQEERRRFAVQGSFLNAASAESVQCTVVYNDAPLTFTDVKASVNGSLYTFQGGFTVPEESLPFTIMAEYSFDGENWFLYEEQSVKNSNAGFYIACKLEPVSRAIHSNIYIRLQWNDNGTRYFSNVLCYATNDIESAEDIGGSRGGGTSIINPPETPQENADDIPPVKEEPKQDTEPGGGQASSAEPETADAGQPQNVASETADGKQAINSEPETADAGQPQNEGSETAEGKQAINAEPETADAGQPQNVASESVDARQAIKSEPVTADTGQPQNEGSETADGKQAIKSEPETADGKQPLYAGKDVNPSEMSEQTLRPDARRNHHFVITAGAAALSVIAGAVGFWVHSLSGTKR